MNGKLSISLTTFNNQYVLLKQYRHVIREIQYGFPGGFGEKQLSAEQNAKKRYRKNLERMLCSVRFWARGFLHPSGNGTFWGEEVGVKKLFSIANTKNNRLQSFRLSDILESMETLELKIFSAL